MDINDILNDLNGVINFKNIKSPSISPPLVLMGSKRAGLSAIKITQRILAVKKELGLPTGTLPDGSPNADDIIIGVIVKEIITALQTEAKIQVSITPQTGKITASGLAGVIPCAVQGFVTTIQTGAAIIQ